MNADTKNKCLRHRRGANTRRRPIADFAKDRAADSRFCPYINVFVILSCG